VKESSAELCEFKEVPGLCSKIKPEYLLLKHEAAQRAAGNTSATGEFIVPSNHFKRKAIKASTA